MIKIFDTIVRWTLYPLLFLILFGIYYIFTAIFWFKLPNVSIKKEFIRDPMGLHDICIADFAYYLSWMFIGCAILWYFLYKIMY